MNQITEFQTEFVHRDLLTQEPSQDDLDGNTVADLDELEYRPIPAQQVLKMKVKVRVAGPGLPMRYPLADEE